MVDPSLPYIKREGMRILWSGFPDDETAHAEIDKLGDFYKLNYPDVYATKGAQIEAAKDELKVLYDLTTTPAMKVTAATYPNHMGHEDWPGCFRCHDGAHYKVVNDVATNETIPSTCNTCHTFPQIGPAVASLPLGEPPSTHTDDSLWVFNHKSVATSLDPGGQTCVECHARDYCVNCHSTGAVSIDHDTMATNHAAVIREQGNQSCAYCHQPAQCAACHAEPVLPVTSPASGGAEEGWRLEPPAGLAFPLAPAEELTPIPPGRPGRREGTPRAPSRRRPTPARRDPLRPRVDVEAVAAQEAHQGHAQPLRGLHGEVARGGDGGEQRDARDGGLLDELEAGPARDQQHPVVQRQLAGQQPAPDELVQGVVPADVLAQGDERPVGGEQPRRVEAAGGTEDGLALAEARRVARAASSGATTGPSGMGAQRTSTWSSEALPQMPQDAVATKLRLAMPAGSRGRARRTTTSSSGRAWVPGSATSMETMSPRPSTRPSVSRNPAASSAS